MATFNFVSDGFEMDIASSFSIGKTDTEFFVTLIYHGMALDEHSNEMGTLWEACLGCSF